MKRIGFLFEKVISIENLYYAYKEARKSKRKKKEVYCFEKNLGNNLYRLRQELLNNTYNIKPYRKFVVYEPKLRIIYAPSFRDVVVQHAIYRIIYPLFDKKFISTTFACRKNYGTHKASDCTQKFMQKYQANNCYLQVDLKRYFYSINRDILSNQLSRTIKDKKLLNLMKMFTVIPNMPVGIPIGNLLSQLYANIYLTDLDNFIKRNLKIENYVRYVDDFILIGLNKQQLVTYKNKLVLFLHSKLKMTLSKWRISTISKGINFVGYRTYKKYRLIRKYSLYNFTKKLKQQKQQSINSLLGHAKRTSSIKLMLYKILKTNLSIPTNYLRKSTNENNNLQTPLPC